MPVSQEDGGVIGTGWVTWLAGLPAVHCWVPSLDPDNADRPRGWAALREDPWHLAGVKPTQDAAASVAAAAGPGHEVRHGL